MVSQTVGVEGAPRPVRVCFVIENLLPAGTELWVARLIERLDRRCVTPLLCLTDGRSSESQRLEPDNCEIVRLGLPQLKTVRTLAAANTFYRFLRSHRVDIVQVHHADPSYLGIPVARLAGVRAIVQTKYDVGYWLTGFDLWMHRRLRPWVDVTVANCEACREAAIQQERVPADRVVVIDNGIETQRLLHLAALTLDDWQHPLQVGMLAHLRAIKDPESLVRAARRLIAEQLPVSFHFAGAGPQHASLQAMIVEFGLQDRIKLHGHVADPAAFLQQIQIFVLCSLSEGLPHALLEAMTAGRAVVVTSVGGNRDLVQNGVNGLLVPPGDSQSLAAAIRTLVTDPELAVRLAAEARRTVGDRFSLPAMTQRFSDFYCSLNHRITVHRARDRRGSNRMPESSTTGWESSR